MALRAALTNFSALVAAGLLLLSLIAAGIVIGLVALAVGGLAALLSPLLGALVSLCVGGALAVAVLVVLVAVSYSAWRDTFGEDGVDAAVPVGAPMQIEA